MGIFDNLFTNKKEEKERLRIERQNLLDTNLEKTTKVQEKNIEVQEKNTEIQKSAMEIAWKNQELNKELTQLVLDNERTKNILLSRENEIKSKQDDLDERQKEIRRSEIEITARKAEVRKNEHQILSKDKELEKENKRIEKRELEAEKVKTESEKSREKYKKLYDEIETDKENISNLKNEANNKNQEAEGKLNNANAIFEKAKVIDEEIKAKEFEFEERRELIEKSLNEKISEYDRRLEDLDAVKGIVDDVKFDKSEEGRQAKIVVKEAIRQAKKELTDIKTKFEELDEKYSSGTFKGFATPLSEIDKDFEDLKSQYIQIKEHFSAEDNLPSSVSNWIDNIEESINNADKFIKSWEFSEAYRNIVWGLSTCKNYEILLLILNDFANEDTEWTEEEEDETDFVDWYEILEINPDADDKEIKKAFRKAAKKHHPDKNEGSKEAEEMFKKCTEANEILSDPMKRKAFDDKRNNRNKS